MDLERWIERTLTIQSIPAPTFGEAERAEHLRTELAQVGVTDLEHDGVNNLLARIPGGNDPPVIVSAHLDSVFDIATDLTHRRTRSRLIGPGVGDNAVALAALVELASDLLDRTSAGDVWLVANVAEEGLGNLLGMREVVERFGKQVSAYIVLEGMALGHIYHRALPVRRYRITLSARGGHSWIHSGRASALHELLNLGNGLLELSLPDEPRTTLNVGRIEGGRSINSIADRAMLEIDMRSESEATIKDLGQQVLDLVGRHKGGAEIEIELVGSRPGGELASDHPLVRAAVQSLASAGEKESYLEFGSTDANLPLHRGFPAICFGVTKGGEAHTLGEYIEIRPMRRGYSAVLNLIESTFSLDGRV